MTQTGAAGARDRVGTALFFIGAGVIALTVVAALVSAVMVFVGAAGGLGISVVAVDVYEFEAASMYLGAMVMVGGLAHARRFARRAESAAGE
ncbi:hypothetical protein [Frondihabitans peucedani]|uniref:Uncharacterized protein n=1 Tax=Frondihabitans peucedani TaxID=598626 RepID=A0ABP8DY38_9MICO